MNINIKEYNIDFGIDPELHIAHSATELSAEKTILRPVHFSEKEGITCELAAKLGFAAAKTKNDALTAGAALLRDCYGKINHLVAPAVPDGEYNTFAKLLKAYRSDIKITVVTADQTDPIPSLDIVLPEDTALTCIDTAVSIQKKDAEAACALFKETEELNIGPASGAALFAASDLAKNTSNPHTRIVVLLPD